jgi:hypothetical protein
MVYQEDRVSTDQSPGFEVSGIVKYYRKLFIPGTILTDNVLTVCRTKIDKTGGKKGEKFTEWFLRET